MITREDIYKACFYGMAIGTFLAGLLGVFK